MDHDQAALTRAAWSGSTLITKKVLKPQHERIAQIPLVYDLISYLLKQTEWTMTRQLSRAAWSGSTLFTKHFKAAERAYCTSWTCVWSDISYPYKQTEWAMTRQLSREPADTDPPCLQKRLKAAARAYSTSSTCFISTYVWSDISYPHKQTE